MKGIPASESLAPAQRPLIPPPATMTLYLRITRVILSAFYDFLLAPRRIRRRKKLFLVQKGYQTFIYALNHLYPNYPAKHGNILF